MKTLAELEAELFADPLAQRLSAVDTGPLSARLRHAVYTYRATPRRPWYQQRRLWVYALAAAAIITLALATPVGAAVARALLPFWLQQQVGLVAGAPTHLVAPHQQGSQPDGGGHLATPNLTLSQAQARVDFHIPRFNWLPADVVFRGALVDDPHSCLLSYRGMHGGGLGLSIHEGPLSGGPAVPSFAVQQVTVDGQPALLVTGSYESAGPGSPANWNPSADASELLWTRGAFSFDLTSSGLHLTREDMLRIATSMTS